MLPVLLRLAERTPAGVNDREPKIGLATTFGRLRAKEGIPFLVKNVTLQRWPPRPNIWLKSQAAISGHLPAITGNRGSDCNWPKGGGSDDGAL